MSLSHSIQCPPRRRQAIGVLGAVILVSIGCGDSSNIQLAGGMVMVDGKPVTIGKVMFYPSGGGRTGSGRIQEDGSFVLSYREPGDGVPLGDYKVTIISDLWHERSPQMSKQLSTEEEIAEEDSEFQIGGGKLVHVVPVKYNNPRTTPLSVSVTKSGEPQRFVFDIPSKE